MSVKKKTILISDPFLCQSVKHKSSVVLSMKKTVQAGDPWKKNVFRKEKKMLILTFPCKPSPLKDCI